LSYRHDKYTLSSSDYYRGNCGIRWDFLRYFFAALDYSYVQRTEDVELDLQRSAGVGFNEYTGNKIMMTIGASKLFMW
jgi:hypothetical protein